MDDLNAVERLGGENVESICGGDETFNSVIALQSYQVLFRYPGNHLIRLTVA